MCFVSHTHYDADKSRCLHKQSRIILTLPEHTFYPVLIWIYSVLFLSYIFIEKYSYISAILIRGIFIMAILFSN